MSIFEAIMLICFGISWPTAIWKTLKSKSHGGKSIWFAVFIILGYLSGLMHKIMYSWDWVAILYIINTLMVAFDVYLVLLYRYREKRQSKR